MAIPLGQLAVSATQALGGYGRGRLLGAQLETQQADKQRQLASEALRLSLATHGAQRQDASDAALRSYLTTHGAADLVGLPGSEAMTEYGRRHPAAPRPSASEGRLAAEAAHKARVRVAKGDLEGLVARYYANTPLPGQGTPANKSRPRAQEFFQFLKRKYPDLPDGDLWDLVGDVTIPKKATTGAPLDLNALTESLDKR